MHPIAEVTDDRTTRGAAGADGADSQPGAEPVGVGAERHNNNNNNNDNNCNSNCSSKRPRHYQEQQQLQQQGELAGGRRRGQQQHQHQYYQQRRNNNNNNNNNNSYSRRGNNHGHYNHLQHQQQCCQNPVTAGGTEGTTPASSPTASLAMAAPKYGTLVPNRIFVGGISANTSEAELAQLFSSYGNVKATKIIADRGGVSKGYGFVTFETEEEAKRLQQESECIVLRERKLNIAPAIKKQSFNRSFEAGPGSPPAVPTSPYYYANGVGLPYQNGVTFYNTGAPAAGIPTSSDPALYSAGVFGNGPQAAASHQTFAPMMYPVPAPSLYMPQQYQYSPVPFEPYYAGSATANAPQIMYTTNGTPNTSSGSANGSGNNNNGTGAPSPSSAPQSITSMPPPIPAHFYAPTAGSHHPGIPGGASHAPPQMEHMYYSFAPGPPTAHLPHPAMSLPNEQQLIMYPGDLSNQSNESQHNQQEDTHSTSSHSEQTQNETTNAQTSDSATPLGPVIKYPISGRFPNYPSLTVHSGNVHNAQNEVDDCNGNPLQYKTIVYPAPFYIPHPHTSPYRSARNGPSLLPTPIMPAQMQNYDSVKSQTLNNRELPKSMNTPIPYTKAGPGNINPNHFNKHSNTNSLPQYKYYDGTHKYPRVMTPPVRLPQQFPKRNFPSNSTQSYYMSSKACQQFQNNSNKPGNYVFNHNYMQPFKNNNDRNNLSEYSGNRKYFNNPEHMSEGTINPGRQPAYCNYNRKNLNNQKSSSGKTSNINNSETSTKDVSSSQSNEKSTTVTNCGTNSSVSEKDNTEHVTKRSSPSPPTPSYSPNNCPKTTSPPNLQVQFYNPAQNQRYHSSTNSHHQQFSQRRHQSSNRKLNDKYSGPNHNLRQSKYKVNGIQQNTRITEDSIGGGGDASSINRLPMTPPGTPRTPHNNQSSEQTKLNETCHQMQALGL